MAGAEDDGEAAEDDESDWDDWDERGAWDDWANWDDRDAWDHWDDRGVGSDRNTEGKHLHSLGCCCPITLGQLVGFRLFCGPFIDPC